MRNVGLPTRETRIVAPKALLAISDVPPACFAHWARQASVPKTCLRDFSPGLTARSSSASSATGGADSEPLKLPSSLRAYSPFLSENSITMRTGSYSVVFRKKDGRSKERNARPCGGGGSAAIGPAPAQPAFGEIGLFPRHILRVAAEVAVAGNLAVDG